MHSDPGYSMAMAHVQLHETRGRPTRHSCFMKWVDPMLSVSQVQWSLGRRVGVSNDRLGHNLFIHFSLPGHLGRRRPWFVFPLSEKDEKRDEPN